MVYINILQVISGNDNGGGGNHVLNICTNNIKDMNCQLACIGKGELYYKSKKLGANTIAFSPKEIIKGKLVEYINKNNIDLVNFHGAKGNFLYWIIKKNINVPTVVTIHSNYKQDFLNNKLKYYLFTPLSILGLKSFNNYICVSKYLKDLTDKDGFKGNKFIVNNGIDFNKFCSEKFTSINKHSLNVEEQDFVFTMVARMHPIKNHRNTIEAFYKLSKEFHNIKLILLGDGEERGYIKNRIEELSLQDKVIILGFKSNVKDYIKISNITILTSFSEGGAPPIAILESGALKVPIIASRVSDIPDIINDSNGYLVDPNSVDDIYNKMKESYLNKDKLKDLGIRLYENILNRYSMDKFHESYYKHYKNILKNSKLWSEV
ncbi:glycosyltransferase [Clostridium tetani]|uniref:glycosyltransferase n=1 Tax=Clostridium tetani TaxID=1513 RepID=UPI000E207F82|nr:glycosyltransferase [Clostridium tetani]RXI77652.1 glycosyltransferase family 1 protein [Clostridium tetani]RXM57409.1 glycosyltransferase family 1 protein [Clostridium tetani]